MAKFANGHMPAVGFVSTRPTGKSLPRSDPPPKESSPCRENFPLSPSGKSILELAPSRALQEGRIAIVMTRWARDAMNVVASGSIDIKPDESAAAYGEVVWS
jgi:hypothetical protein